MSDQLNRIEEREVDGLRIALAQINTRVGDSRANAARVIELVERARKEVDARLVVFPELTLSGYPPEDLLLRRDFVDACEAELAHIAEQVGDTAVLIGTPGRGPDGHLQNQAVLIDGGRIVARYAKQALPNYGVFDEKRYFRKGTETLVTHIDGVPVGVVICEDAWREGPIEATAAAGARVICVLNASPFHRQKTREREAQIAERVHSSGCAVVYVNLVGGQDELVFDGRSFVSSASGNHMHLPGFAEAIGWTEVSSAGEILAHGASHEWQQGEAEIYRALTTGIADYVRKNGFSGVVLGLSGGIDSSLVLALAVDALGADNVLAVRMPSQYTSPMSLEDAELQCEALGVRCETLSIEPIFGQFKETLGPLFAGLAEDVTEENLQARARGVILMAMSNKFGRLLLTTGNKSELAVGYATLYGDMAGGFAPIKDVPKTVVYQLARYRNTLGGTVRPELAAVPERVITREPSAELRADQLDSDSLPAYEDLDRIIEAFVEDDCSIEEIVAMGLDEAVVRRVVGMILVNEYKRRQAPPGVRISRRAFGRDRRYPISSGFRPDKAGS
ncbi:MULTISPECIES: NAD+ synthase [unclassified Guyparkeria]|uniref:NAD+ synthase n=1 Tax=unclassified Guyparkeria TaxID=2626246 RepID=UPI000A74DFCA|nr:MULTISPECIES: NAD+ synthase [unclassified Guyparkeria]